jgi:hypothetical protein
MDLLERPSKMKIEEFLEIHKDESIDVISLLNEYNTLLLFTLHKEFHKKITEIKTIKDDNSVITSTEFHLADLQSKIFEKLN